MTTLSGVVFGLGVIVPGADESSSFAFIGFFF